MGKYKVSAALGRRRAAARKAARARAGLADAIFWSDLSAQEQGAIYSFGTYGRGTDVHTRTINSLLKKGIVHDVVCTQDRGEGYCHYDGRLTLFGRKLFHEGQESTRRTAIRLTGD